MKIVNINNKVTSKVDSKTGSLEDYIDVPSRDLFHKTALFGEFIADARNRGYEKYLHSVIEYKGGRAVVEHRHDNKRSEVIMFCTADYLDLAHDPKLLDWAHAAVDQYGTSVSSVPLIAGSTKEHRLLENRLEEFLSLEDIVLFPTGHSANTSTISALTGKHDLVLSDRTVHESIGEGIALSNADARIFKHYDTEHLEKVLKRARSTADDEMNKGILITVEGVCGLDGDIAPLPEIMDLAEKYDARVLLDDAHATGVLGNTGRGTAEHFQMKRMPDIHMGSFSKSLGSVGGWIGCSNEVADYLRYFARTVVYSVGMSPIHAAIANSSLSMLGADTTRLKSLNKNAAYFRNGLLDLGLDNAKKSKSAIMSVMTGGEINLRDVVADLFDNGIWAEGLGYPAVRHGEERVRFRIRSAHTLRDLDDALDTVAKVFRKHKIV